MTVASSRRPLIVLCVGGFGEARAFAHALQQLDCQPEMVEAAWMDRYVERPTVPTILYLDSARSAGERVLSVLHRSKVVPSLTVMPHGVETWDPDILNASPEFVCWPCSAEELRVRLDRALSGWTVADPAADDPAYRDACNRLSIVGGSASFRHAMQLVARVARCDAPVLIEGETGVGKELAARAVHYLGVRRDGPFVPVNCGAIPDNLIENELFGHERGAYTDAKESRGGLVSQAERGTLFLDEVETLSPRAQVVLLRFLQDRCYRPLGGRSSSLADVRIVAASNADLLVLARRGSFREDLLYRLSVVTIRVPPLRDRREDMRSLAEEFIRQACTRYRLPAKVLHASTLEWMMRYDWPGNVRELENFIHQACVTSDGRWILAAGSHECGRPTQVSSTDIAGRPFNHAKALTIAEFERTYLEMVMRECQGNVTRAARLAGKERRAFGKLLKRCGLRPTDFRSGRHDGS